MFFPTNIYIAKLILVQIQNDCINCFPMEACGFLIGSNTTIKVISDCKKAENMSMEPNRYTINPYEYYKLETSLEGKLEILGFYHSHPNGSVRPSTIDKSLAWQNNSYLIVSLTRNKIQGFASWIMDSSTGDFIEEQLIIK